MITVYALSYNEEAMIQFTIDHYRSRFPNCNIVFYDNMSTDNTVNIALKNNCQVVTFDTGNKIYDSKYLEIKHTCWKVASTDWVLVGDMDELLDIDETLLRKEEANGNNIISSQAYDMVNLEDNLDIKNIKYGYRNPHYDKWILFNKKYIKNITYFPGCHEVKSIEGSWKRTEHCYNLYHYKHISFKYEIERNKLFAARVSEENKKQKFSGHYSQKEEELKKLYNLPYLIRVRG